MPPETPAQEQALVSIICRSIGRAELAQALQSVAAQTYPNLEVVLVDASGKGLGDVSAYCGTCKLVQVADGQPRRRAAAANAGLDAASGEYLLLLDDDDWIAPTHIENLLRCLQNEEGVRAAYSNTQKTDQSGAATDYVFKEAFDSVLLMRDNYIPIHAMLFHRSLLLQQCRFDPSFDIYEDWDFWLQLSQHTRFAHVDAITAFYREGGESETAADDTSLRYRNDSALGKGRAAIFAKWMPHWSGAQLNQLIGSLDQSHTLKLLADELHEARVNLDDTLVRLNDTYKSLDSSLKKLNASEVSNVALQNEIDRISLLLQDSHQRIEDLQKHADNQQDHILELTAAMHQIYNSLSWKLMGPFRRARQFLNSFLTTKKRQAP